MIGVIARHESRVFVRSPFAWLAAAALQLILGWLFLSATDQYTALQQTAAHTPGSGLTSYLVVQFIAPASIVLMLATPLLCMNLIAADRQTGRDALFTTAPVAASEVVVGKFIAAMCFQLSVLALNAMLVASLALFITLDFGHLFSAYLGLGLFVALATSITLLFSSLTRLPALAGFLSFTCMLLAWMIAFSGNTGGLSLLSPSFRMNSFMQGVFQSGDLMYFICTTALALVLCSWRMSAINQFPQSKP